MARTRTLAELRTECRQRTEQEGSKFVSDAELTRYLNQSIAKLYGKLVRARGDQYYKRRYATSASPAATAAAVTTPVGASIVSAANVMLGSSTGFPLMGPYAAIITATVSGATSAVTVMTVAGVEATLAAPFTFEDLVYTITYAEELPAGVEVPANFFKLLGIDATIGGLPVSLDRLDWSRRAYYSPTSVAWSLGQPLAYDFEARGDGGWLTFYPAPTTSNAITVWYVPHATVLVSDTDTFDGINGWEHYAVLDACIAMLDKEESSSVALREERKHVEELIDELAGTRDEGMAWRVERRWSSRGQSAVGRRMR